MSGPAGFKAKTYLGVPIAIEHHGDGSVTLCKELVDDIVAENPSLAALLKADKADQPVVMMLQQEMDKAKDEIVQTIGETLFDPEKGRIKRIAYLDEERHRLKWWQFRRRRYYLRQLHKEASDGYWSASNPLVETMFKALMERTK